jgi:hypothetical protein
MKRRSSRHHTVAPEITDMFAYSLFGTHVLEGFIEGNRIKVPSDENNEDPAVIHDSYRQLAFAH